MADTLSQRILRFARNGWSPADIASFLNVPATTVLGALTDLTTDGANMQQRILTLLHAGHHPDEISDILNVSVQTVQTAAQNLGAGTTTSVLALGGQTIPLPPYR